MIDNLDMKKSLHLNNNKNNNNQIPTLGRTACSWQFVIDQQADFSGLCEIGHGIIRYDISSTELNVKLMSTHVKEIARSIIRLPLFF